MRHVNISGADSDFHPMRIQQQHEKRRGKLCRLIFFVATNFTKLKNILFFEQLQKNN
jgi:hypothetical protein